MLCIIESYHIDLTGHYNLSVESDLAEISSYSTFRFLSIYHYRFFIDHHTSFHFHNYTCYFFYIRFSDGGIFEFICNQYFAAKLKKLDRNICPVFMTSSLLTLINGKFKLFTIITYLKIYVCCSFLF